MGVREVSPVGASVWTGGKRLLSLTSPFFVGLFLKDANLVMSRPGISEKSLKRVSSMSGVVASGLKSVISASMFTSY